MNDYYVTERLQDYKLQTKLVGLYASFTPCKYRLQVTHFPTIALKHFEAATFDLLVLWPKKRPVQ